MNDDSTSQESKRLAALLGSMDRNLLEHDTDTIYAVWRDLSLAYMNAGWDRFASENEGVPTITEQWGIPRNIMDAVAESLRPFYQSLFERAAQEADPLHPVQHEYECSSPEHYRRFLMSIYNLNNQGFLVVHSLITEQPHDENQRPAHEVREYLYVKPNGIVTQCAHCRRIRVVGKEEIWHWVPDWVRTPPPNVSHGLCRLCAEYYFGPLE